MKALGFAFFLIAKAANKTKPPAAQNFHNPKLPQLNISPQSINSSENPFIYDTF
ncbi:MAG: hypothetical protein LBG98_00150 [Puniceicoccales bacterium]|jgi:hypothetical protein|nr:hypothetical protein [Puniceicoccales bacterium]